MDLSELTKIIKLVEESGISELELEEEGVRIRIKKEPEVIQVSTVDQQAIAASQTATVQTVMPGAPAQSTAPVPLPEVPVPEEVNGETIKAPMVGTFYRSPSPDAAAFVQIGTLVDEETVVCILEAMKVMNEIKAGTSGKVGEILVENTQPVEFGQPLFKIVPA